MTTELTSILDDDGTWHQFDSTLSAEAVTRCQGSEKFGN